jgi:hypothetical protein
MYEQFGAVVDQDNKVEFKLFFPDNTENPGQFSEFRGNRAPIEAIKDFSDCSNSSTSCMHRERLCSQLSS